MEKSTVVREAYLNGNHHYSYSSSSASQRHVSYSCGVCGYELNLSSSNRNTSTIGSKYRKSIKRGKVSFFFIDESRFTQVDEFQCVPFFSKNFRRTALLCRKCGSHIGIAYDDEDSAYPLVADGSDSSSASEGFKRRKYDVKIRALQPSSAEQFSTPLYT